MKSQKDRGADTLPTTNRICIIGEVMVELCRWDFVRNTSSIAAAGDTYNTAVHMARLLGGKDWAIEYVTLLGQDGLSDEIAQQMEIEGVSTRLVGRHANLLPGIYAIELDAKGERSFRYWRSASAARQLFSDGAPAFEALDGASAIVLSLITLAILPENIRSRLIEKLVHLRKQGVLVAFDSNYRPALWKSEDEARSTCAQMYRATSLALPSRDDEARLWPGETVAQTIGRLTGAGVAEIAMKNGATGPLVWDNGACVPTGQLATIATPVDTTGAGDAFNAGYIAARVTGATAREAAMKGHELAGVVLGVRGAIPRLDAAARANPALKLG